MLTRRHPFIALLSAALILGASCAFAADDGLGFQKKAEGKYVTVYASPGWDAAGLVQRLDIRPSDAILAGRPVGSGHSSEEELTRMLDTLFIRTSNILDMHLDNLKTDIRICKTAGELNDVYNRLFNASLGGRRSFYVYDFNSIYVSEDDFRTGVIGHEMSHAIISHYFAIPAPAKVQEVLSMYVEYNLRTSESQ